MRVFKHGLPGIGITGKPGKKGKSGNAIYFGTFDSFFTFIGNDILKDLSIDYDDIDYNITYANNEERLNPKYNKGDILYITSDSSIPNEKKILYAVEITDKLTTCTKSYFKNHITYNDPFTKKFTLDNINYILPVNIVNTASKTLYTANEKHKNSQVNITYVNSDNKLPSVEEYKIEDDNIGLDNRLKNTYNEIPGRHIKDSSREEIINNGDVIHIYDYQGIKESSAFLSLKVEDTGQKLLNITPDINKSLNINVKDSNNRANLYIDNLYIKNNNYGNVEAYNALYESQISLDENGNCYTLTENDYDVSSQSFKINVSSFFTNDNITNSSFNFGYTHMYWNYSDQNYVDTYETNHYRDNYIRKKGVRRITVDSSDPSIPLLDSYGAYIRNWDSSEYKKVNNIYIKQLLINTYDYLTLYDVSLQLNHSVSENDYNEASTYHGIITTGKYEVDVNYETITEYRLTKEKSNSRRPTQINPSIYYGADINSQILPNTGIQILPDGSKIDVGNYYYVNKSYEYTIYDSSYIEDTFYINSKQVKKVKGLIIQPNHSTTQGGTLLDTYINNSVLSTDVSKYIDTNFYSYIEHFYNPSDLTIKLDKLDNNAMQYRHHQIIQWVQLEDGLKYYSKPTDINFNWQDNSFNIDTTWTPRTYSVSNTIDKNTLGDINLFDITFNDDEKTINIATNIPAKYDDDYITNVEVYENSSLLKGTYDNNAYIGSIGIVDVQRDTVKNSISNSAILDDLYIGKNTNIPYEYVQYTIKYSLVDEEELKHIATYSRSINGFNDYRKLPTVTFKTYNDIESLEKFNRAETGILCNQFQTFIGIKIDNFSSDDWGKMSYNIKDPNIVLNMKLETATESFFNELSKDDKHYNVSFRLLKPTVDIFNITQKDLYDENNIKESDSNITFDNIKYSFNISEAEQGMYYFHMLIESTNPEPVYIKNIRLLVNKLQVNYSTNYDSKVNSTLHTTNPIYYSDYLNFAIAPISLIADKIYNSDTNNNKLLYLNDNFQYKDDNEFNLYIKPYKLEDINDSATNYLDNSTAVCWNAIKFKLRYLQDNIQNLEIFTQNINNLKDIIPDSIYDSSILANDNDDISYNYLQLVYDSNLLNIRQIDDQYQFSFNGDNYLASQYGQLKNQTALFFKEEMTYPLRNDLLISSLKVWNDEYKNNYYKDSDNPYIGHNSTYGNGYQYLSNNADTGQYNADSIYSLSDILSIGNNYFFDTDNKAEYEQSLNHDYEVNTYTPSNLFRSLLYQLKWSYPKYETSDTNMKKIISYDISVGTTYSLTPTFNEYEMPYNLCYNMKPRIMYNDEYQFNVILMLRRPCVTKENKYEFKSTDLFFNDIIDSSGTTLKEYFENNQIPHELNDLT